VRLWVDTDVGSDPDDAIALLCAVAHPAVDLVAVSTVDDPKGARSQVAHDLVGEVPVTIGTLLDPAGFAECDPDAVLAIGPLTNVARLVHAGHPPRRLAVMGGALEPIRHRGTVHAVEHNFGGDPDAAALVLERVPDVLVCPLDVTVRTCLDERDRQRLVDADRRLGPMLEVWENRVCLHDPLALLALVEEPLVRTERRRLGVGADGVVRVGEGAEHDVVVDVDVRAFTTRVLALLEQGSG
jgi:inosine-uridine nucleoside N-ribohydrolase